jgi:hypothetical protein
VVHDVDYERERLIHRGLEISPPIENPRERYREIRLHDPEGTPLTFFSWTGTASGPQAGH